MMNYALGRGLLLWETWETIDAGPLELQKAALIDFASNYPRALAAEVEGLGATLKGHGIFEPDVGDLFAARHFHTLRGQMATVVNALVARGLLEPEDRSSSDATFRLSDDGRLAAATLSGAHARSTRAVLETLAVAWRRRNSESIRKVLSAALHNETAAIADFVATVAGKEDHQ